ncbi:MAG: aromatic ring-hydroxylating oxygenase subunit alpha [Polymorphobacter sp.]|jgi:phenylpropionate dioxygenase-like ring-hydroxylating dioxygenase large terminal subunit
MAEPINDARTAPVAVWQMLSGLKGDALKAWRLAETQGRASVAERGLDIPYPFGWYPALLSSELAIGEVKPLRYFGRDLVIWRGEDGQARMLDAYCRHLGAHMGYGGKVDGNNLECPFHAWRYDETGVVREIPYAKTIPPQVKRPCAHQWPVAEANRWLMFWYHPDGTAPQWEVQHFAETTDPDWSEYEISEWNVWGSIQNMAENGVDVAHFKYVHGTASFPDYKLSWDGIRREAAVDAKMGTPRGEVDGRIAFGSTGPGQSWTRFTGISETLLVACITPVDKDHVQARFCFTQPRTQAEGEGAGLARALIRDICKQFDQDKVIWDRQRYLPDAVICDGDGPIAHFRRYYRQFYAEWAGDGDATPLRPVTMERSRG